MSDPLAIHADNIGNIDYEEIILDMPIELGDEFNVYDFIGQNNKSHYTSPNLKIEQGENMNTNQNMSKDHRRTRL